MKYEKKIFRRLFTSIEKVANTVWHLLRTIYLDLKVDVNTTHRWIDEKKKKIGRMAVVAKSATQTIDVLKCAIHHPTDNTTHSVFNCSQTDKDNFHIFLEIRQCSHCWNTDVQFTLPCNANILIKKLLAQINKALCIE